MSVEHFLQLLTAPSSSRETKFMSALVNQTKPGKKCTKITNEDKKNTPSGIRLASCCQCLYFAAPKSFDAVFVYVYMINVLNCAYITFMVNLKKDKKEKKHKERMFTF